MDTWGRLAMEHWQRHLLERYAELEDPVAYFEDVGVQAGAYYVATRDGLLDGVNPNNGTIGWPEFLERVAQADQTARSVVEAEMIYVAPDGVPGEGVG